MNTFVSHAGLFFAAAAAVVADALVLDVDALLVVVIEAGAFDITDLAVAIGLVFWALEAVEVVEEPVEVATAFRFNPVEVTGNSCLRGLVAVETLSSQMIKQN
jgi:hypothetical protein